MQTLEETKKLERETRGYKTTLRKSNPDLETAKELYRTIRDLESRFE
jgi:hypothetical protein